MGDTKWPRLLVVGEPVTERQANEIIIRTTNWSGLFTNDKTWERGVSAVLTKFGHPGLGHHSTGWSDAVVAWQERIGALDLFYLNNNRIMSAWYGGPHGWCDWNGDIGCTTWNIGKWPSNLEVSEDWRAIAAAFPYLELRAQCVDDEGSVTLGMRLNLFRR